MTEGSLHAVDLSAAVAVRTGPAASDMIVSGGFVYGVAYGKDETRLVRRALNDESFESLAILTGGPYRPVRQSGPGVVFVSETEEKLIVLKPANGGRPPDIYETRGAAAKRSADGRRLLYWNDFELHIYDIENNSDELITRVGTPIVAAAW